MKNVRTIKQITESLIDSYNNNEKPNYIDLRDLETHSEIERIKSLKL